MGPVIHGGILKKGDTGNTRTVTRFQDLATSDEEPSHSRSTRQATKTQEPPQKFSKRHGPGKSIAKHGQITQVELEDVMSKEPEPPRTKSPKKRGAASKAREEPPERSAGVRRSPRKKIIDDEPRPEDTMNPFPRPRAPMLVSDKPAVINKFGEKVPAPLDPDQKLRNIINFLSDEGPESHMGFEKKLDAIEYWLKKYHPNWDGFLPPGQDFDTENLGRRVRWMIWAHRARLEEGAEEWFTKHLYPNMPYAKPIPGSERWHALNKGVHFGAPKYPKLRALLLWDLEEEKQRKKEEQKQELSHKQSPKKGQKVQQAQQPQTTQEPRQTVAAGAPPPPPTPGHAPSGVKNDPEASYGPWHEPMPRPEVWHRKESGRFPFGETPAMEMMISREIQADLARGAKAANPGWSIPLFASLVDYWKGTPAEWSPDAPSPWKLPKVDDAEVRKAEQLYHVPGPRDGKKRNATVAGSKAAAKKPRAG